ncbi:MAG: hypothetical protein QG620_850 [Patescibacteria group bacterium]|nr:hypothetical protein [Patescibacteria group bacterium]
MKQKNKKTKKYFELQAGLEDFLFVFLFSISLVYGGLFWAVGQEFQKTVPKTVALARDTRLERSIGEMVKGYPIENMASRISMKDPKVAAFMIGVAKKESNWGKFTPKLNGEECYNFWGYRGQSERMTKSGYTCFSSSKEAVNTVAARMGELVKENNLDTPEKMVVWKCGWNCEGHSPESVSKWIADVGYYFNKINNSSIN